MFANMHANVSGSQKRTLASPKAVVTGCYKWLDVIIGNPILVLKTNQ